MNLEQFEEIFEKTKNHPNQLVNLRKIIVKFVADGVFSESKGTNVALKETGTWASGAGFPKAAQGYSAGEYMFLKVSDMNLSGNEKYIVSANNYISQDLRDELGAPIHPAGTIIFPKIGGAIATNKRRILTKPSAIDNNCLGLVPNDGIHGEWLYYILLGIDFAQYQSGTATPALKQGVIGEIQLYKPDTVEEQKRIVAKVDELMALCDELENTNQKTNRTKLTYLKSVTQHICDSAPGGYKQHSLSSALERAPRNAEGIQELKKVCINFGIYMNQQSDEENGKFFDKMQEHTDKMKANKALPKSFSIQQSESELFSSIACLSLGSVAFIEKGKTGIKSAEPGVYPLVVTAAERQTCKSYDFETKAAIVPLVSSTGHGHASIQRLHYQSGKFALGTILAAIVPFDEELFSSRFIYEYLNTFKEELLVSKMTGTANVTLSVSKISEVPIPMVSPRTQKWICDFCETCDQIEISLHEEENIKAKLLKTLVA